MKNEFFPLSEIFGPTIQGEGMHAGKLTTFIRFAGCDSRCEWCDTKYAWGPLAPVSRIEIVKRVTPAMSPIITLTGGNPLLYNLGNLVEHLFLSYHEVHVETQGTVWKDWLADTTFVSVSPKSEFLNLKVLDKIVKTMTRRCQLKVVIFGEEDIEFLMKMCARYPHIPVIAQIGCPSKDGGRWIADRIIHDLDNFSDNLRILPQIHRVFWGDTKGV